MSELTPQEFRKDLTKSTDGRVLVGLLIIFVLMVVCWVVVSLYQQKKEMDALFARSINGILTNSEVETKGFCSLKIRQTYLGEELNYSLRVRDFFEENRIKKGDSLVKKAMSDTITFFQKEGTVFKKCCDLYTY